MHYLYFVYIQLAALKVIISWADYGVQTQTCKHAHSFSWTNSNRPSEHRLRQKLSLSQGPLRDTDPCCSLSYQGVCKQTNASCTVKLEKNVEILSNCYLGEAQVNFYILD